MKRFLQLLFSFVLLIPIYFWGVSFAWNFSTVSLYLLFPLLGLLAFSIMWVQVVVSAFEKWFSSRIDIGKFWACSGIIVLILFIAHPLLALIGQYGYTQSWNPFNLVSESEMVFIVLALIAFATFIVFEVTLRWKNSIIQKIKPWIENGSLVGIILVWVHSLNIGSHTRLGFMRYLWWFYGITAMLMIGFIFWRKFQKKRIEL